METAGPNEIWPADLKGQFKTGDRKYCFSLTVTDHYSRMILLCKALRSIRTEGAKPAFRTLFREYGLPDAIRTDNGPPFASTGIHGLCELNVWWTTRDRSSANPPCAAHKRHLYFAENPRFLLCYDICQSPAYMSYARDVRRSTA